MKKRIIILSSLVIVISLVFVTLNYDKNTFKQDGVIFALTMDGETITSFPEQGKYSVDIECENGEGKWLVEEWKVAIENISGNVTCNIAFSSNPTTLKSEVESVNTTNNNGYRYSGKQPDNWVEFNNEKWRIIGSIPVTLSAGTTSNLVKIIRSNSLGNYSFDVNNTYNTWGDNTLFDLLNNYYYGKKDVTGASPCYGNSTTNYMLCNYEYIGIDSDGYYNNMIEDVYWNVGGVSTTGTTITNTYTYESGTQSSVTGKIGLMNISDYGYASGETTVQLSKLGSYVQNNWLYIATELTMTTYGTSGLLNIASGVTANVTRTAAYSIRPVVYLDSSVYIVSGDGSISNPYQIGM